ncbi:phosphatase PAP2 family protein [Bradyrhizobium sp. 177]|uniref:phosphatase PAP2 family protein n=1 Tax=Bradyrhizobium sp. 177 TaxID=2782647 RepID=UPI001FF7FE70|nr:phosphatase PAP2 family protein [Bradyrhizobium sp. 177]MCK1549559.1 phosphatase PAP2 family protein [Bradyrhizobium sp. 177]
MTNATMTSSLAQAVTPAQYLGPVAIFQWPLAWALIGLLLAVDFMWAWRIGLEISGSEIRAGLIAALLALSAACRRRHRAQANMLEAVAWLFAFAATASVLTYLAASCAFPLQDVMMERWDLAIGFDWSAWHAALLNQPTLNRLLMVVYNTLFAQFLLAVIYFSKRDRSARIEELMLLMCATVAPTALISALWPTLGPFAVHGVGDVTYLRDVLTLRAAGPWHFESLAMQGIVPMPSFHTVLAVLFTYAFRGTGLLGYGIATLNLAMLLSIPPIGGHYLVDVLAGAALALGAIAVQRATQQLATIRIRFGLWCETRVGKVLDSVHGFVRSATMPAQRLGRVAILQWRSVWAMICLLLVVEFVWASRVGLSVGTGLNAGIVIIMLVLSVVYDRRNRAIADMTAATASWVALMSAGLVLSYLAASCARPLQDGVMERLDRVVGFDWLAWHDAMLSRPALSWLLTIIYYSLQPQAALSIVYLAKSGRTGRLKELLLSAGVTLVATISVSAIWPTLGPCAANGPSFGPCATNGGGDIAYLRDLLALRAGGPWHFELSAMEGIVAMPSYHTVGAVLLTYAFRGTGLIGYGIAALNVLMLVSIPPIGGHYLVDVLAGAALALGAIAVQRAARHGMGRILFVLARELVGKMLNSVRSSVFKPAWISARALAVKSDRPHDPRR